MDGFLASPEEFSRFYRADSRRLLIYFSRRTFDPQAALDLTAETFAAAFTARRTFKGHSEAEAGAWLFTIARRQLARYFEKGLAERSTLVRLGVQAPAPSSEELDRIEALAGLDVLRAAVRDQLALLDGGHREALWLRVVDEEPYSQVATRLGISEQAARMRVSRALRSLSEALGNLPEAMQASAP